MQCNGNLLYKISLLFKTEPTYRQKVNFKRKDPGMHAITHFFIVLYNNVSNIMTFNEMVSKLIGPKKSD